MANGPLDMGRLLEIKSFINDAYDEEGRRFLQPMEPEMLDHMILFAHDGLVRDWVELTDLPFPDELIASAQLERRMQNLAEVQIVLEKCYSIVTKDRKKNGQLLMEQLAIKMAQSEHLDSISVVVSSDATRLLTTGSHEGGASLALVAEPTSTPAQEREPGPAPELSSIPTPSPEAVSSQQPQSSTQYYEDLMLTLLWNREPPILKPRPIIKEKVFKKLSGDGRRIPKRANAEQSEKSFLLCTIVGYRGRECVYVEPVGTCGIYENEARYLIIDSKSTAKNYKSNAFMDLPATRDIEVHEVERVADVENPDVMSLLTDKPVWRVKTYVSSVVPVVTLQGPGCTVFVEGLHPDEHAVTVNGPHFHAPQYLHMGCSEMPPLHSFLEGPVYYSDYKTEAFLMLGALIYVKVPLETPPFCSVSKYTNRRSYFILEPLLLTDQQVEETNAEALKRHRVPLKKFVRETLSEIKPKAASARAIEEKKPKKNVKKSGQKNMRTAEHNHPTSLQVVAQLSMDNGIDSNLTNIYSAADLSLAAAVLDGLVASRDHLSASQLPLEVAKPDSIRCNLCQTDIQPTDEVYFKVTCLEDCHLFCHRKCMQDSLAGQGLRKKREYKEGVCLTEGCAARIQDIHEYSIMNKESLYLKCAEQSKVQKKTVAEVSSKKKLKKVKNNKQDVDLKQVVLSSDVHEEKENAAVEVPAPPRSTLSVVPVFRPVLPPPKPNRSVPLPVDIENVVPLEKRKSPLEHKYAVSEQPQKKMKTQKMKKTVVNIEVGIRREQNHGTRDEAATPQNQRNPQEMKSLSAANGWEELYNDVLNQSEVAVNSNQLDVMTNDPLALSSTSNPCGMLDGSLDGIASSVSHDFFPPGISNQLNDILTSIDSCLQDLVLNTPPFKMGGVLPVSQLKEALFLVAGDRLNNRQKAYIEKIFCGALADPESFRLFVSKLKYFSVSRMENNIIYCKNRAGRQLEEEQRSVSIDWSDGSHSVCVEEKTATDTEKIFISVQTEQTKSYEELVRERDEARKEAEDRRLDAEAYRAVYMTSEVDAALRVCRSSLEHVGLIVDSLFPQNNSSLSPIIAALLETKAEWIELENVQMERRRLIQSGQLNNLPPLPAVPVLPDVVWDFFQRKVVNEEKSHKQKNVAQPSAPPPGPVSPSIPSSMSTPPVNRPDRPVWGTVDGVHYRHVDLSLHECKICLDVIGNEGGNGVLSCPECVEPYHNQCVRGWLSTNSTCPQCRRNWPDPVDFPGLGEY